MFVVSASVVSFVLEVVLEFLFLEVLELGVAVVVVRVEVLEVAVKLADRLRG